MHLQTLQSMLRQNRVDAVALGPGPQMAYVANVRPHADERPCLLVVTPTGAAFLMPELNAEEMRRQTDLPFFTYADADGPQTALTALIGSLALIPRITKQLPLGRQVGQRRERDELNGQQHERSTPQPEDSGGDGHQGSRSHLAKNHRKSVRSQVQYQDVPSEDRHVGEEDRDNRGRGNQKADGRRCKQRTRRRVKEPPHDQCPAKHRPECQFEMLPHRLVDSRNDGDGGPLVRLGKGEV
jgi:hypothetical protein